MGTYVGIFILKFLIIFFLDFSNYLKFRNDYDIQGNMVAKEYGFSNFESFMESKMVEKYVRIERDMRGKAIYKVSVMLSLVLKFYLGSYSL